MEPFRGLLLASLLLFIPPSLMAHEGEDHSGAETLGFEDKTGTFIPLDVAFTTAEGESVVLADLVKVPTIFVFQYYRCTDICEQISIDLASALDRTSAQGGSDYRVALISIDPSESPADARTLRDRIAPMFSVPQSEGSWEFLTGSDESIDRITDATGFHYRKIGQDFEHPIGLVFVSPEGKITRYVHGLAYLPAELNLSIMEASSGTVAPAVAKVLRFCFSYDPTANLLVFNATRVTGGVTLTIALGFISFLFVRGRKRRRAELAAAGGWKHEGGEE